MPIVFAAGRQSGALVVRRQEIASRPEFSGILSGMKDVLAVEVQDIRVPMNQLDKCLE